MGVSGATNQQWALDSAATYTATSDTSHQLTILNSGLVTDVSGGFTAQNAQVIHSATSDKTNQTWKTF